MAMAFLSGGLALPCRYRRLKRMTCMHGPSIGTGAGTSTTGSTTQQSVQSIQTAAFRSWASGKGICMPDLEIAEFADGLRGVRALLPLLNNATLISVPSNATLQVNSLDKTKSPFPSKVHPDAWKMLPWYARLALVLHNKKNDPAWKEWIALLPDSFDTPFHWPDASLVQLQSPRFTNLIHSQRKSYRKLYDTLINDTRCSITTSMSYKDFVWAIDCVRSRSFSGPLEPATFKERFRLSAFIAVNTIAWPSLHLLGWNQAINGGLTALLAMVMYDVLFPKILKAVQGVTLRRYALAPGIDFVNHCGDNSSVMGVSYEYFADKFVARSQTEYKSGEQVFVSYGAQGNDSLLQYYGFTLEDNPNDEYVFGELAEKMLKAAPGTLRVGRNGKFADDTIDQICLSFKGSYEDIGCVLQELCTSELDGFPTSLEEDEFDLRNCENSRMRTAIQYRMSKKKILRNCGKK